MEGIIIALTAVVVCGCTGGLGLMAIKEDYPILGCLIIANSLFWITIMALSYVERVGTL